MQTELWDQIGTDSEFFYEKSSIETNWKHIVIWNDFE